MLRPELIFLHSTNGGGCKLQHTPCHRARKLAVKVAREADRAGAAGAWSLHIGFGGSAQPLRTSRNV
jgi:hypothetical protein